MYDPTPAPFGTVTRRWTQLTHNQREDHAHRLIGRCAGDGEAHVDDPPLDDGRCYSRLIRPAVSGDEVALGWLATTHRPLLLLRGRALFRHDPSEWGAVCLEILHAALDNVDLELGPWLRRRISQQLASRVTRATASHLSSRGHERPTAPAVLHRLPLATPVRDPHPELSQALTTVLDELDAPTRDAFYAIADDQPMYEVADRHELSYDAMRQRVSRARRRLQPELVGFVRNAS